VGARERTVRGRGGGERHGVEEIGCGELRRELHERAREGRRPPDMGGDGLGSEGGGERAERVGRDEGRGSNDGKTSAEYARGLRESRSVGEADVMLVGFRMRNGFRERLVMGLKERRYHGTSAKKISLPYLHLSAACIFWLRSVGQFFSSYVIKKPVSF